MDTGHFEVDIYKSIYNHENDGKVKVQFIKEKVMIQNIFQKFTLTKPVGSLTEIAVHHKEEVIKVLQK